MKRRITVALASLGLFGATPAWAGAPVTLKGSPASMQYQNEVARAQDYTFLRTPAQVRNFVERGYLVPIPGSGSYRLSGVSYPYARSEMELFLARLSAQYREACGKKLVVTSLTRPSALQPRNSHPLSVHPTGMAVDLRIPAESRCRSWLEETLLSLERGGLLDATRERRPPHYHIALFTEAYREHVARIAPDSAATLEPKEAVAEERDAATAAMAAVASPFAPAVSTGTEERAPGEKPSPSPWIYVLLVGLWTASWVGWKRQAK